MDIKVNVTNLEELEILLKRQKELVCELQENARKISCFCSNVEATLNYSIGKSAKRKI